MTEKDEQARNQKYKFALSSKLYLRYVSHRRHVIYSALIISIYRQIQMKRSGKFAKQDEIFLLQYEI